MVIVISTAIAISDAIAVTKLTQQQSNKLSKIQKPILQIFGWRLEYSR